MKSTLTLPFSNKTRSLLLPVLTRRLFLLTLVAFVAVAALLSIAAYANKANRAAKGLTTSPTNLSLSNTAQQPAAPLAPAITATLSDNIPAATKVAPGGTINYTATITNTGVSPTDDATNLNFSDTLDSNTTLTAGSIHASPLAFNDTYNWVGNTFLDTAARALPAVTANDVAVNPPGGTDTFTLTTIAGGATSLGGSVTLAANGSFTYTPPLGRPNIADGALVNDTFTYTIVNSSDATLIGTGTVTIALTGRVWYLQAGAAGDGRSNTPSGNAAAISTSADKATDILYVYFNASTLNGAFTLDASQQLIGQGVALVANAITLITAGSTPNIQNTSGNAVTLGLGNTLAGFNILPTSGTAIIGSSVGTLNISSMTINTTGAGLDLTGVSTPTVNVVLGALTSTGGAKNVSLVGLNGTVTLGSGALSGASGNAFDVTGAGTANISYSGTISNTAAARLINISGKTGGTVAFSGAVSGTGSSTGINLATNTGATINFTGGINLNAPTAGFAATGGGTVTATQNNTTIVNTLTTTTGTALNITNTTIGASGLTFRSISSNGATNGIILNSTGATGGLTVSGNGGSCTSVGTCTGGTIQSAAIGVSLATTTGVSFDRMFIQNTTDSGINGTAVTNFSFTNGKLDNSGNAAFESNIAFNTNPTTASNVAGTLTLTGNTLTNAFYSGLDIQAGDGTITNANISNNTFISTTSTATSVGFGININGVGTATTAFSLNNATITGNTITNFPSASGIQINGGNSNASGPRGTIGIPSDPGNLVSITSNAIQGQSAANRMGGSAIIVAVIGGNNTNATTRSRSNINISNNPTLTNIAGTVIGVGCNGHTTMTATVNNNVIVANHQANLGGANGIGGGDGIGGAGAAWTPALTLTVTGNNISQTDGNGILLVNRATNGTMDLKIATNTVGAPINAGGTARQGIRADSGNNTAGENTNVCVTISGNTSAGSNGAAGIGIRKQGSTLGVDTFGITGLAPSPATGAEAAAFVVTQNAAGGGCDNISGSNFVSCASAPPIPNPGDEGAMNLAGDSNTVTSPAQAVSFVPAMQSGSTTAALPIVARQQFAAGAKASVSAMSVKQLAAAPKKNRSDARLSHHALRSNANVSPSAPNAPLAGEVVTLNTIATFPAGKSITIKYAATVNTPPTTRQVSTQGTISGGNFVSFLTDDPDLGGASDPTVTLVDTLSTWTGATSTDWNVASNWTPNTYVPGTLNPGVNDVVIPNVGAQPNIISPDANVFSLSLASGRTLTINGGRTLTINGGAAGSDLTLDGIIGGGALNFAGAGPHVINNAGGTGSLTSTNLTTLLSPASVTLNNNLQMGALAVNSGATLNITNRTLSLNGSGAALTVGGTLTTTGSTVVLNGTAAQTIAGTTYNNLTINNTIGAHVTGVTLQGNATVNGALTLTSSDLATTGAFTLTMPATATSGPATSATDVVGNVKRTGFVSGGTALSFGNPFNTIRINSGIAPTDINILIAKNAPTSYISAVQRSYTITPNGGSGITATLRLHYRQSELNGNSETPTANFNLRKGPTWGPAVIPTSRNVGVVEDNWLENNAVTAFSEWTFSNLAPTASSGVVTGRIVDNNGVAVEGAVVRLAGTQNRKFITDANGFYRFDNVETNGFYTVTPSRANYTFNPSVRSFSQIGETTEAAFGATLTSGGFVNPLDTPEYFVRQHYLDFLGREPDEAGFNFWSDQILECDNDNQCIERRRENVSAAYFLSIEFQQTGGLVDGLYRASYGVRPQFAEFMPDTRAVALGVVVGHEGWEAKLEANKQAFVDAFVQRPAFINAYGNMDNNLFVDTLISHTGVSFTAGERDALVSGLANGTLTRSAVLRSIAENERFVSAKFNEAFVMMEYFGYLRRDPDASGYAFWLNKLSEFNGNFERAEMVKAFIVSGEYRDRFPR